MGNFKRVYEVVVLLAVVSVATAAPAADCTHDHYDQRQTGTENTRVNVDGFVFAVAPAESLVDTIAEFFVEDPLKTSSTLSSTNHEDNSKSDENVKPEAERPLSDVTLNSDLSLQRKDGSDGNHDKAQRLKQLIANAVTKLRRSRHE